VNFRRRGVSAAVRCSRETQIITEDLPADGYVVMYGVAGGKKPRRHCGGGRASFDPQSQAMLQRAFHERKKEPHWSPPDVSRWAREKHFWAITAQTGQVGTRKLLDRACLWFFFAKNRNLKRSEGRAFGRRIGICGGRKYIAARVAELADLYRSGKTEGTPEVCVCGVRGPALAQAKSGFAMSTGIKFLIHEGGCGRDRTRIRGIYARCWRGTFITPTSPAPTVLRPWMPAWPRSRFCRRRSSGRDPPIFLQARSWVFEQHKKAPREAAMLSDAIRETFSGLGRSRQSGEAGRRRSSQICLGLKCGGSDGFFRNFPRILRSGTPPISWAALGGKGILSEFPGTVRRRAGADQSLREQQRSRAIHAIDARLRGARPRRCAPASR